MHIYIYIHIFIYMLMYIYILYLCSFLAHLATSNQSIPSMSGNIGDGLWFWASKAMDLIATAFIEGISNDPRIS